MKLLKIIATILIGSVITVVIDNFVGINFEDVSSVAVIAHKVIYGLWGAIILSISR